MRILVYHLCYVMLCYAHEKCQSLFKYSTEALFLAIWFGFNWFFGVPTQYRTQSAEDTGESVNQVESKSRIYWLQCVTTIRFQIIVNKKVYLLVRFYKLACAKSCYFPQACWYSRIKQCIYIWYSAVLTKCWMIFHFSNVQQTYTY